MYGILNIKTIRFVILALMTLSIVSSLLFNISIEGEIGAISHAVMV